MPIRDPRIDAYIASAAPFAQPILERIREVVHVACPDAEEAIKWGMPAFMYRGAILASMAAFKQHASFGVWTRTGAPKDSAGMGRYGRLSTLGDLPDRATLTQDLAAAMTAIDARKSGDAPARKRIVREALSEPDDLVAALATEPGARDAFDALAPGCRREYIEWIVEAKRAETRAKRIAQTVQQAGEGKALHWKYQR